MRGSDEVPADTAPRALSDLWSIEITYQFSDRFGMDRFSDPNIAYVDGVYGEIVGLTADEDRVLLGHLSVARIDLFEVGDGYLEVLDAESADWTAYVDVIGAAAEDRGAIRADRGPRRARAMGARPRHRCSRGRARYPHIWRGRAGRANRVSTWRHRHRRSRRRRGAEPVLVAARTPAD